MGYYYANKDLISFSAPPMFGGTDQLDYNNMAFSMMETNIPGILVTNKYKKPFKEYRYTNNIYITRILKSKNTKKVRPYAYRPLFYPIVLGYCYKIFGYSFKVARSLNIFLITIGTILLYLIIKNLTNQHFAFLGALSYLILPNVIKYSNLLLSEIFVVTIVILFFYILQKSFQTKKKYYWFLSGLTFGFLILSKQMFYLILFPLLILFIFYFMKIRQKHQIFYFLFPVLLIIFPWFTYNIAITGNTSLKMGTSGWHDMPSAYSQEYLEGKNRFKIREQIFHSFEKKNNIKIQGDIERSIYGKKIFFTMLKSKDTLRRIPKLMYFKIKNALVSNHYIYLILFIISLIAFFYFLKKKILSIYIMSIYTVAYMNLVIVSITFSDHGRLISATFPLFIILNILLAYNLYKKYRKTQR
jgi:4-amino-4-deoxy-L-arabinose transferase-like glycosyltransferase